MGKSTISMASFNCYVSSPEGNRQFLPREHHHFWTNPQPTGAMFSFQGPPRMPGSWRGDAPKTNAPRVGSLWIKLTKKPQFIGNFGRVFKWCSWDLSAACSELSWDFLGFSWGFYGFTVSFLPFTWISWLKMGGLTAQLRAEAINFGIS